MYAQTDNFFSDLTKIQWSVSRTIDPLESTEKVALAHNNLNLQKNPSLPEKRGSTLLRSHGSMLRQQSRPVPEDNAVWEPPVPPPPPRRDNVGTLEAGLSGQAVERVPLTSGDLILDNGTSTILVRGDIGQRLQ